MESREVVMSRETPASRAISSSIARRVAKRLIGGTYGEIYRLLPFLETEEYKIKEIRWSLGTSTYVEIGMERR